MFLGYVLGEPGTETERYKQVVFHFSCENTDMVFSALLISCMKIDRDIPS